MNKEIFKCILSVICMLCGSIMSLLSLFSFDSSSPAFIACVLLGISLMIIGIISFFLHYKGHKIIQQLKNKDILSLAHWQYAPMQFESLTEAILRDRSNNISIVILLGILALLICLGILFSSSPFSNLIALGVGFISIITCILSYVLICIHYHNKLLKPIEVIIGENYIYFYEELHSLERSFYLLTEVKVEESPQPYLQFSYSSPCSAHSPVYTLNIPVPPDQIDAAKYIKEHYMHIIH